MRTYSDALTYFKGRVLQTGDADALLACVSHLAPASRIVALAGVRAYRRMAGGADLKAVRILVTPPSPRPLAPDVERRLQAAARRAGGRIAMFYALCRDAALRPSEALALTWSDVCTFPGREEITIRDPKGRWTSSIPIDKNGPAGLLRRLKREGPRYVLANERRYVIASTRDVCAPWSYRAALDRWVSLCASVSVRAHPHQLRHTAATAWLRAGVDQEHVRRLLRHRSSGMLARYAEITPADLRRVLDSPPSPVRG